VKKQKTKQKIQATCLQEVQGWEDSFPTLPLATKIASELRVLSLICVGSLCSQWRERLLQGVTQG